MRIEGVNNKFKGFTNEEIYMLHRQAIESSYEIMVEGYYNPKEGEIHTELLNQLSQERKSRNI